MTLNPTITSRLATALADCALLLAAVAGDTAGARLEWPTHEALQLEAARRLKAARDVLRDYIGLAEAP